MSVPSRVDTVVIGAGHAGLTMSRYLGQAGREHVVLDRRATLGGGWQDRWDAFRLVTPNWTVSLPDAPYDGADPDGFMPRDEIVARLATYAERIAAPVVLGTEVRRLTRGDAGGFRVETSQGVVDADRVIVATGSFHVPRIPPIASAFPPTVTQVHSHAYRDPASLPPGGVLVVGSGQSGAQIAEELFEAGRDVYLSVGSAGRVPRRYRGRDIFRWLAGLATRGEALGVPFPTVDTLPHPRAKFAGNPHLSGHGGGRDTNLREFAQRGMTLLGRIERVDGDRLELAPDLSAKLAAADRFFLERFQPDIDTFIERAGIDAPADDATPVTFEPPEPRELRLDAAGIRTVVWATGYRLDYGWIDLPILDEDGYPRQRRGVTDIPGLYFLGLLWQHTQGSATLLGPTMDGRHVAAQMELTLPPAPPPRFA